MEHLTRRGLICAATVGVTGPLLVDESASAAGRAVVRVRDVPIGGGVVVVRREVVVTRPRRHRFHVFSAICTHQGCTVERVEDRRILCPCHGAEFAITDGRVLDGPANGPLPRRAFTIKRGKIYLT